ncbi:hypothetical protein HF086_017289 [Spodoptera exigua]|uniref:Uncharacterized protein n=1 Tax=Spodoptera exigua TaxID=7107 RepID=A0A922M031_SPOEX|nr:hypothetical protein HF086_017289 [Spodoptera exigua]
MALCESQLDSALPSLNRDESPNSEGSQKPTPEKKPKMDHNGEIYGLNQVPSGLPLTVDYRSPVSHFVPPELYAPRPKQEPISTESSEPPTPVKRKRGRPRVDKTSPEYLANLAARKQAKEMAAMMNNRTPESGEKRKRGRPRVDKTSPEYLARKKARELEALERKAKREYKRRATGAFSFIKTNKKHSPLAKVPKTSLPLASRIKKRSIPANKKKNNVAVRKIPAKVGNTIRKVGDKKVLVRRSNKFIKRKGNCLWLWKLLSVLLYDDLYDTHLLAVNFKKPLDSQRRDEDEVLSVRSSEERRPVPSQSTSGSRNIRSSKSSAIFYLYDNKLTSFRRWLHL